MNIPVPDSDTPLVFSACRLCGWNALTQGGLCYDCKDIRDKSAQNRAFCAILHRESPLRKRDLALEASTAQSRAPGRCDAPLN